ncbi:MAG: hypothetical protein L0Z62_17030 [Gemmataceae bacterium]|nr:hypothetical protein [Gemmataceae bacterium]
MKRRTWLLVCLAALAWVAPARGQGQDPDEVFTRASKDKPAYRGFLVQESPRGIVLKGVKDMIPVEEIEDISFDKSLMPVEARFAYRNAEGALKKALAAAKPAERGKALNEALAKYDEALAKFKEAGAKASPRFAKSHMEYRIAHIRYLQGREPGKEDALRDAVAKLKAFRASYPKAWQTARVLPLLAQAQMALKQYAEAEQTYRDLASADVPAALKQDAAVEALLVTLEVGKQASDEARAHRKRGDETAARKKQAEADAKLAQAEGNLRKQLATLPAGSRQLLRGRLALAECLGTARKLPEAKDLVKKVLAETKDRQLRTLAYNTMGYCYWQNEQWQDARWEFLWVDVVYNQDKAEHAKALYYLWDIFAQLGDGDRSRECHEMLVNDPAFAGTEHQSLALAPKK